MEQITLKISGMVCGGCANSVQQALLAVAGVIAAEVSHVEAQAVISYDPTKVTAERLTAAIASIGYQVSA